MILDHEAIYKAYPDCTKIDDSTGAFRADGTQITLVQSDIDAARTTLNSEYAALEYSRNRAAEYPSIEDQLDTIYHSGVAGWKTTIKAIKDKYPKP
jgi:L-ascorbate metabolism protein UlaG (beta-lactamase superfamily)|tara:strand:+ start:748 stop:1035 length:288 start_codon:yes stop_codon:yes gene_type:complete